MSLFTRRRLIFDWYVLSITTVSEVEDDGIVGGKPGFLRRRCRKRQLSQVRYRFESQTLRQRQPEQMEEDISFGSPRILTRDWITDGFREVLLTTEIPISFR